MSESPVAPTSTNPLAIASVVLGSLSLPCFCLCYGLPFNVLAVALGAVAISQVNQNPQQGGKALAQVGLGLGVLSIVLGVTYFLAAMFFGLSWDLLQQFQ
jgi:hypothetical protein